MPVPTDAELEERLVDRLFEHIELMDRYDSLGKAVTSELARVNLMSQVGIAQSYMPEKIKLNTDAVDYMSELLKKTYAEFNGHVDI